MGSIPHAHIELAQQHRPIVLALGKWRQGVPGAHWVARLAGSVKFNFRKRTYLEETNKKGGLKANSVVKFLLLLQRTRVLFPAPTLGGSQLPVVPALGIQLPLLSLTIAALTCTLVHRCT